MTLHSNLSFTKAGMDHLIEWEAIKLDAYIAPEGQWTIGLGCTYIPAGYTIKMNGERKIFSKITKITSGMKIDDKEEAIKLAYHLIDKEYGKVVLDHVKVPITNDMYEALVSLSFNIGVNAFKNSSVLSALNNGDYELAAVNFIKFNKHYDPAQSKLDHSQGLINRRMSEMHKFIKGFNKILDIKPNNKKKEPRRGFWHSIFN